MKKLLPKRKPERKPSDEEFALRKSECGRGPGPAGTAWGRGGGFLESRAAVSAQATGPAMDAAVPTPQPPCAAEPRPGWDPVAGGPAVGPA